MLRALDGIRDLSFLSVLIRLLLAFACGAIVGLERSYKNRPAGFRTHILVCIGAALADITGLYLYLSTGLPSDPTRIGAQVVAGLGFIGAGTIIVTKKTTVKGLTTAAGLWTTGVAGLAIGSGFYEGGVLLTAMILLVEMGFQFIDPKRIRRQAEFRLVIHYAQRESLDQVLRHCKNAKLSITNLQITAASQSDASLYAATIALRPEKRVDKDKLIANLRMMPGIDSVDER